VLSCTGIHQSKHAPRVSLETARAQALARVPGEVRSEELEREHGRWIYSFVIKPLGETQPTVRELNFDADTGEFVNEEVEKDKR
jgi:uncharacterized membrane protein YkoI